MTQLEGEEARSVLNLHQPFIISRRRNAASGENAREEVCCSILTKWLPNSGLLESCRDGQRKKPGGRNQAGSCCFCFSKCCAKYIKVRLCDVLVLTL
jgi:hypothetical protein